VLWLSTIAFIVCVAVWTAFCIIAAQIKRDLRLVASACARARAALMGTAARTRDYYGPAVLSYGFRPFFLLGAVWAALVVALWLPVLKGTLVLPTAFSPLEWHVHELVYGYVPAIMAGFLLTAVPNWTGRLPVTGTPLLMLVSVWAAGRAAILLSGTIGVGTAAVFDLLFLAVLAGVVAREIVAGHNLSNLKVLAILSLLFAGNVVFHVEAIGLDGGRGYGTRIGIGAAVLLITLIGGRIVPSFTRNWLARERPGGSLPAPFSAFDAVAIAGGAGAICSWIILPHATATAGLAGFAALLHAVRLARWAGYRTGREPLVLVLHVAYAFVPLGFLLLALAIAAPRLVVATGALHGWTVGAIGTMTLGVMTRASLGHTGRPLVASLGTRAIFAAIVLAAVARVVTAFDLWRDVLLPVSATAWVMAFAGFALTFGPLLVRPRATA
jgi:uncharacterized protein involved in response to NO